MTDPTSETTSARFSKRGMIVRIAASVFVLAIILLGIRSTRKAEALRLDVGPRMMMGTFVRISVVAADAQRESAEKAIDEAFARVDEIDRLMSAFKPDSDVGRLNADGKAVVSEDTFRVLTKAQEVSRLTDGAFDITVPPLIRLWKSAAKKGALPTEEEIKAALVLVGYQNIALDPKTREVVLTKKGSAIDLGGIAKGYAVDAASEVLRKNGMANSMVEAGGEVYCHGRRNESTPWRIGVQDPRSEMGKPLLLDIILGLSDIAVATSGDYQQYVIIGGKHFSHIINPHTGQPADDVPGATIIAPDCTTADALATSVSVMGVERGMALIESLPDVQGLLITAKDGQLTFHESKGFDKFIIEK